MTTLQPLGGSNSAHSFAYWGERSDWLVALSQHRDSDAIDRSNWRTIAYPLIEAHPEDAAIESFSNWAVGWSEVLLVKPGTPAATAAQDWADKLADYPAADDEDWSLLEYNEEWCVRCDRGTREDHPLTGCRAFRSENDAAEIASRWRYRHA
jgi:hypothetical protein